MVDNRPTFWEVIGEQHDPALLPDWYQPTPMARRRLLVGWKRHVVLGTIIAFVAIDAFGLCSTYGHIVFA